MKNLKIIAFAMALCITFCSLSAYSQDYALIPIKNQRNRTLITVKINNITIPDILLDTGFDFDGIIIYNPAYRDSLALPGATAVSLGGAGGGNNQDALMIDSAGFYAGSHLLTDQRIIVLQTDIYKGFPSDGIIGHSLFGHYTVEIDYDRNILILHDSETFEPDADFIRVPVYFRDSRRIPWIDASVVINNEEPVNISAYIDFADGDPVVLLERQTMKFNLPETGEEKVIGTGLSGDIYGRTGKISKLIIADYQLSDVRVSVAPAEVRSKQKDADAVIGCGALNRFNLIFDYKNESLYIKPNKSFSMPFTEQ